MLENCLMQSLTKIISKIQNSKGKLYILCGFSYSGKSYLAKQIVAETNFVLIGIDSIFELKGFSWDYNVLPNEQEWVDI